MAYVITPRRSTRQSLRRVAVQRIDDALDRLDALAGASHLDAARPGTADPVAVDDAVHEIRKRCKEVRGLAQLVRPSLGPAFRSFDRLVRDAAAELSSVRDAQVLLGTLEQLQAAQPDGADTFLDVPLDEMRTGRSPSRIDDPATLTGGDARIERATELLRAARAEAKLWKIPKGFAPLGKGLGGTYRRGVRWHRRVERLESDERFHEWRKAVKHLWYQMRLLERAAPSVLGPLVAELDRLADALGDDHDLAVLVEQLHADPDAFGGTLVVDRVCDLARTQQRQLRQAALRAGATIYAESPAAFVERIGRYWHLAIRNGPERPVGGIDALAAARRQDRTDRPATRSAPIERERKWLLPGVPHEPDLDLDLDRGTELRQGYLAIDGDVSVRVRDAGPTSCTFTLKIGRGSVRTELEWPIDRGTFDRAWAATDGRRVVKSRYRAPLGDHVAEIDVFGGALDGLVMVEVEFVDDDSMAGFVPPAWFGREVSDDVRYTNASLAVAGLDSDAYV